MKRINKKEFNDLLKRLPSKVKSKTGRASYSKFELENGLLTFRRDNTGLRWKMDTGELFEAYQNLDSINTKVIQQYVSGRVYSPSCAVLIAIGLYDADGNLKL